MSHPLFDIPAMAQQVQHMQQLAADATSGAIKVDEGAGQAMIVALDKGLNDFRRLKRRGLRVADAAKLGTSPAASVAIPANVSMATGNDQSLDTVLDKLIEMAQQARDGIQQAMDNYRNIEHANQQGIKRAGA